ncbi:hypothetical protein [Luteimonas saliphila]|uniref:hypothetical protein n=1 Tax=Luteimonas saliphila TaxID=2804919 RepID=UPI00192D803A|nr:hypothetical protein [Luteimonas saliphila]
MARSATAHAALDPETLQGAIKLRAHALDIPLSALAKCAGLKPSSIRARLSISRGKRALQPWQVTKIAQALELEPPVLHRLAARHEGWQV